MGNRALAYEHKVADVVGKGVLNDIGRPDVAAGDELGLEILAKDAAGI